jgi:hypothetical protein
MVSNSILDEILLDIARLYRGVEARIRRDQKGELFEREVFTSHQPVYPVWWNHKDE